MFSFLNFLNILSFAKLKSMIQWEVFVTPHMQFRQKLNAFIIEIYKYFKIKFSLSISRKVFKQYIFSMVAEENFKKSEQFKKV